VNLPESLVRAAEALRTEWYAAMLSDSAQVAGFTRVPRPATDGEAALAKAIVEAERKHHHACLNGNTLAQVAAFDQVQTLRYAFALATGTAISGMEFNLRLQAAHERAAKE